MSGLNRRMEASRIMQDFLAALESVRSVSFDVFDTLVFRRQASPRALFVEVGQRAAEAGLLPGVDAELYADYRMAAESRARALSGAADVSLDGILACLPWSGSITDQLKAWECELEVASAEINPLSRNMLDQAIDAGKTIVFASDMYLPAWVIRRMLSPWGDSFPLYLSCEADATKATGALFSQILQDLNLAPAELLHVGDHVQGDDRAPRRLGCRTVPFRPSDYATELLSLEKHYAGGATDPVRTWRYQATLLNPYRTERDAFFFDFGALVWGPTMQAFAVWLRGLADTLKLDRVLFAMREGALFEACCRQVWGDLKRPLPTAIAFLSRRATFAAGLDLNRLTADVGKVLERAYASVDDILADLGIDTAGEEVVPEHLLPWLADHEENVRQGVILARDRLRRYIEQMTEAGERVGVFDFGGGGSILRNLCRGAGDGAVSLTPLLFFLHPRALKTIDELGFLPFLGGGARAKEAVNVIARNPEICEILLTGTTGSSVGYVEAVDGTIEPVLEDVKEDVALASACKAFADGIQAYLDRAHSHRTVLDPAATAELLARVLELPLPEEALHLGNLEHEDNLGLRRNEKICSPAADTLVRDRGLEAFWLEYNRNPGVFFDRCKWPQGTITRLSPDWLRTLRGLVGESDETRAIRQIVARIESAGVRQCAVYGAGLFFEALSPALAQMGVSITHLIDRKAETECFEVGGLQAVTLSQAFDSGARTFVIASVAFADQIEESIMLMARERGVASSVSVYSGTGHSSGAR